MLITVKKIIFRVKSGCPRLLINKEKVGMQDRLSRFLGLHSGLNFDSDINRDVALLGDCDHGCQLLAEKLGWGVSWLLISKFWNM